jgi:hypothetical protein
MRTKRIIWFLVMIALGVGLGLFYGWMVNPVRYVNTAGESLRSDYKTDYILMVAEIYAFDGALDQAARRLSLLGSQPPAQVVAEGIVTANALAYAPDDVALMNRLAQALEAQSTTEEAGERP